MSLPSAIQPLFVAPGPAGLVPGPRSSTGSAADVTAAVESAAFPPGQRELIRATLLLWHDHLEAAHQIAQGIENADGSYVHALMHRREPDYSNAKYWFRRVGQHPCFTELLSRVRAEAGPDGDAAILSKLVAGKTWDPFAFVDLCEANANAGRHSSAERLLRRIQQIEFGVLLEHFCKAGAPMNR